MSKQREALELALEALDHRGRYARWTAKERKAIREIKEALAEPELEFWPGDVRTRPPGNECGLKTAKWAMKAKAWFSKTTKLEK